MHAALLVVVASVEVVIRLTSLPHLLQNWAGWLARGKVFRATEHQGSRLRRGQLLPDQVSQLRNRHGMRCVGDGTPLAAFANRSEVEIGHSICFAANPAQHHVLKAKYIGAPRTFEQNSQFSREVW